MISHRARARRLLAALAAAAFLLAAPAGWGADDRAQEYAVKAAFLYNFAKFIDWPAQAQPAANEPFVIGVLGTDPFGPALDALARKSVRGRNVAVRRFETLGEGHGCQILFISRSEKDRLASVLAAAHRASILTVGDLDGFAERGGIIGLVVGLGKVRLEVNADSALAARLTISSQLLKLATRVEGRPQ